MSDHEGMLRAMALRVVHLPGSGRTDSSARPRNAVRAACLAGADALRRETWQPIETAPKDGRTVLVFFPQIGVWAVSWEPTPFSDGFWCVYDNKSEPRPLRGWLVEPTHWMPLPAAPTEPTR